MSQNEDEIAIKELFSGSLFQQEVNIDSTIWETGFDVNRQLIFSKLGFYQKVFLRPEKYTKRFYHTTYPLLIEDWEIIEPIELYDGFCTMQVTLDIRFQATLAYVEKNLDYLFKINQQIKSAYETQLLSVVRTELNAIKDGAWLKKGLADIEKKIALLVSETLILHHIQAQTLCTLKPVFKEFPQIELTKENINISLSKKEFEIENQKQQELYRQEIEAENNQQQQKLRLLKQLDRDLEIERRKLVLEAEHKRLILVEKEGMQIEYFAVEERLLEERLVHENRLKEINLEADFKKYHAQKEAEQKEFMTSLKQQHMMNEKQLQANISRYESQQKGWLAAKERVHIQKLASIKKREKSS